MGVSPKSGSSNSVKTSQRAGAKEAPNSSREPIEEQKGTAIMDSCKAEEDGNRAKEREATNDEPAADEPERRFRFRRLTRQISAMSISGVIHMVALVTLGLVVVD